ncbi:nitroreductase family deazaflavin-dependent oxidoreductase [Nonomuraea wenchangensis]|uniref:nitroreductase family deazaflavin-dependent oxidoreductase n=1 Tax=Nonomuraea wenchangensis TaxID=568860 RepID=UPI0037202F03
MTPPGSGTHGGPLYALKRLMYRHGRPGRLARAMNRLDILQFAAGRLSPRSAAVLEVRGRASGRTISVPVAVADVGGRDHLVSMLGEEANWVRNVRAAGGDAVLRRSGGGERVHLEEVVPELRAPILRRYLELAPGARPHIPVDRRAPEQAFAAVAPSYPVFLIRYVER